MKKCFLIIAIAAVLPLMASAGKAKVLKIDFKNPITERVSGGSSFDIMSLVNGTPSSVTLLSYIRAIDAAAEDKNIGMIYMTPENVQAGTAQLEEIRAALERFRKSGKPVVAYCSTLGNGSYYLASVADKIILDPASESMITGLESQMIFLKDILDALHIDVQLIRHGKYKSAGEMYTRSSSSPENRLQNEELVNSMWNSMTSQIAASRGFTQEQFNEWVENLDIIHAQDFKAKGLVDETWYKDEVDKYLCEQNGVKKIDEISFVKINRYASKVRKGSRKNRIAVVFAEGEIMDNGSDADIVGSRMANTLRKVREDKKVKAVVFRVNSPGGSAQAAEAIRHEIQLLRAEKPVIVSFGDYAASGGYWISAESDQIFTDNNTITGSIGVFGMIPDFSKTAKDIAHVGVTSVKSNAHSDMFSMMRPLDQAELATMQADVEHIYDAFTTLVAEGRKLDKAYVDEIAQGRVWSGAESLGKGLTDEKGTLEDALRYAASVANGDNGSDLSLWEVVSYPAVPTTLEQIMGLLGSQPGQEEILAGTPLENAFQSFRQLKDSDYGKAYARMSTEFVIR